MKKWLYLIISILIILSSCKTVEPANDSGKTQVKDPTRLRLDQNSSNKDELRTQIESLFTFIETQIEKGDFKRWYNSISKEYKDYLNNQVNLKVITEKSDYLYNRDIKLKTPQDYFMHVVRQSREGMKLKFLDYKYINKNHLMVICSIDDEDEFSYDFIFEDDSWKIAR